MNILILGNGGREHALAWKAAQSAQVQKVFVAPGNAGTALENNLTNVDLDPMNFEALIEFVRDHAVALTIVGPEAPLVAGIVDRFQKEGLAIFGPGQDAAQLEGSKSFAKAFMKRHQIPTASYEVFTHLDTAKAYVQDQNYPLVIKADGLAAGKGVVIAQTLEEAFDALESMLEGQAFGEAGHRVVIESFLTGEEASYIAIADGKTIKAFATSQDHKARDNGDQGPNTGGMGAYSPAPVVTPDVEQKILQRIMQPTLKGLADEGMPYTGFLYAGVMIDDQGDPYVVEYNCRFGDPETQPIMMRMISDLIEACTAAVEQRLEDIELVFCQEAALGVVMAAGGYPLSYNKGDTIQGLDNRNALEMRQDLKVFHAGTRLDSQTKECLTNGGRVLCVTAKGINVSQAQQHVYNRVATIQWNKCYYRNDIGYRAIEREKI